jgi:hypothetical protein
MTEPWMDARDALDLMTLLKGGNLEEAKLALLTLLKTGAIRSIAARYDGNPPGLTEFDPEVSYESDGGYYRLRSSDVALSNDFWGLIEWRGPGATVDWQFGIFSYSYYPRGRNCKQFENANEVRLEPSALRRLVGERTWATFFSSRGEEVSTAPVRAKNSGGRPPAPFADDLMCAIWASIYRGDLKPQRQADVERAIKDWTVAQGHDLGDTSAREKARKIWNAMNDEVENPNN